MEMDIYLLLCLALDQLGIKVSVVPELTSLGVNTPTEIKLREQDVDSLAHEAVHALQRILLARDVFFLFGLDPLEFNPDLPAEVAQLLVEAVKEGYPPEEWEVEIPAYALELSPLRVIVLLRQWAAVEAK
ncbi:MAG: hypothetical protein B7C55_14830 [Actinomycetales bacterium mxb001]|nr:MAG: hypothetical protein B7C55_14830 [Actinomycetales bacterium mxb001]